MPQSFEGCAGELPRNKGGQGRIRKESWFPNGGKKTFPLEDPDKGQKGAFGKEMLEKEEFLLRELVVQDKKGQRRAKILGDFEKKGWSKQERQRGKDT